MIRTIVTAEANNLRLTLPDNFLGKQVEVIAFVIEETSEKSKKNVSFTILDASDELKINYQFNRDEANER